MTEEKLHRDANCFLMLIIRSREFSRSTWYIRKFSFCSHGTADNFLLDTEGNKTWNIESLVTEVGTLCHIWCFIYCAWQWPPSKSSNQSDPSVSLGDRVYALYLHCLLLTFRQDVCNTSKNKGIWGRWWSPPYDFFAWVTSAAWAALICLNSVTLVSPVALLKWRWTEWRRKKWRIITKKPADSAKNVQKDQNLRCATSRFWWENQKSFS